MVFWKLNLKEISIHVSHDSYRHLSHKQRGHGHQRGVKKNQCGVTLSSRNEAGGKPPPELHAGKGSMIFQPQFTEKYVIELVVEDNQKDEAIKIIRENSTKGKIFVTPNIDMIDIKTGNVNNDS